MSRHEVITLQFGSFANFSGAHYWNIQVLHMRACATCVDRVGMVTMKLKPC